MSNIDPKQIEIMPSALRSLADQIQSPDDIPAMCLREAADMIEALARNAGYCKPRYTIELKLNLTNGNDGRGNKWFKTAKVRKDIEDLLRAGNHVCFAIVDKPAPIWLRITRLMAKGQRYYDEDSLGRGNSKELIDSLKACGWFHDDSRECIRRVEFRQIHQSVTKREKPGVLIEMFDWIE